MNFWEYKLSYYDSYSDLIIYFITLIQNINLNKFTSDIELFKYINKCIENYSKKLLIHKNKESLSLNNDLNFVNGKNDDGFSNVELKLIINTLPVTQKNIVNYKYFLQFTDSEIAKKFNISRQAVNKSKRKALKTLKNFIYIEVN